MNENNRKTILVSDSDQLKLRFKAKGQITKQWEQEHHYGFQPKKK